jgi:hypothetical protein
MYKLINFTSFIVCLIWIYFSPSWEPIAAILITVAGFFRDDIKCIIGKNIYSLTPKNKLIRNLDEAKFSFINSEFINPLIIDDLSGWLSDKGDQIVAINLSASNNSNRYFGEISNKEIIGEYPIVTGSINQNTTSYQYLGCSFSGIHLIKVWNTSEGTGVFYNVMLVTLSLDSSIQYESAKYSKVNRFNIKLIGTIPLGDRYDGIVYYKFGFLTIPACKGIKSLRIKKSRIFVL